MPSNAKRDLKSKRKRLVLLIVTKALGKSVILLYTKQVSQRPVGLVLKGQGLLGWHSGAVLTFLDSANPDVS